MTREARCKYLKSKGYKYNSLTGIVANKKGVALLAKSSHGYIRIDFSIYKKTYHVYAHQFAWYISFQECVELIDHENHIKTDNRLCNLKASSKSKNSLNTKKNKGCSYNKEHKRWRAYLTVNKKVNFLGYFVTETEAHQAYLKEKSNYINLKWK